MPAVADELDSASDVHRDVASTLRKRGHAVGRVHYVYGPGDPQAALDPFGSPATTALYVSTTGMAKTALLYTEAYTKRAEDGGDDVAYRMIVVVRDGWLAVVE